MREKQSSEMLTHFIGRPLKVDNNILFDAISRIAISGSASHEKRRADVIRTVKTLDELAKGRI